MGSVTVITKRDTMPTDEKRTYVFRLPVHYTDVGRDMLYEIRCDIVVKSHRVGGGLYDHHIECKYNIGSHDDVLYSKTDVLPALDPEKRVLYLDGVEYDVPLKADRQYLERVNAQLEEIKELYL